MEKLISTKFHKVPDSLSYINKHPIMSVDYKKKSDNSVNYITWNFNLGVVLYKNVYNFLLLYT